MSTHLLVQSDLPKDLDRLEEVLKSHGLRVEKVTIHEETSSIVWHSHDDDLRGIVADQMESYKERSYDWVREGLPEDTMQDIRDIVASSYEFREEGWISTEESDLVEELLEEVQ